MNCRNKIANKEMDLSMNASKFYFFCPNCGFEEIVETLPKGTMPNIRDGYGRPINHYECKKCHNLDAGFMSFDNVLTEEDKSYYQHVIKMYQNIRGIKKV